MRQLKLVTNIVPEFKTETMNQPDLGNYISNLRKEQGLTQEELVEKCNINVRTIQRIEAGEVTPRSYTIKNILEALGSSFDDVFKKTRPEKTRVEINKSFMVYAIIAGMIYFISSTLEVIADTTFATSEEQFLEKGTYLIIKIISLLASTIFLYGSVLIGKAYKSPLITIGSACFIVICLILGTIDGFIYMHELEVHDAYHLARLVVFGILYALLGTGYLLKRNEIGRMAKWCGIMGLIGGICLVTIILTLFGIVFYTIFEILLMVVMYQLWSKK